MDLQIAKFLGKADLLVICDPLSREDEDRVVHPGPVQTGEGSNVELTAEIQVANSRGKPSASGLDCEWHPQIRRDRHRFPPFVLGSAMGKR